MSPLQRYVSKELTHFVGRSLRTNSERYEILHKILSEGWLTHAPHENRHSGNLIIKCDRDFSSNEMYYPETICFCDIPVDDLDIHVKKYSQFGLSFLKSYLVSKGANPVFYLSSKSMRNGESLANEYDKMIKIFQKLCHDQQCAPKDPAKNHEYRKFISFLNFYIFSFVKFFKYDYPDDSEKNYYMEREWRLRGNLTFDLKKVHRVIIPKAYARRFRKDFPHYSGQLVFL